MHVTAETIDETRNAAIISKGDFHLALHHKNADGYITMAQKTAGGMRQAHYRIKDIPAHLAEWVGSDVYFSQNSFYLPKRRIEFVRQFISLYADIDFYTKGLKKEWVVGHINMMVEDGEIPEPSYITHSGNGLIVVWSIEPVPFAAIPLWTALQEHLYEKLKHLGADRKATDAARVFRVAGTTNSKNGAIVGVEPRHDDLYTLKELKQQYLPYIEKKPHTEVKKRPKATASSVVRLMNVRNLHFHRLKDLVKLVELREYDIKGYRETLLFYYRYLKCCFLNDEAQALRDALDFNAEFIDPLPEREVIRATKSAEKAYKARADEKAIQAARARGYQWAGYNPSNKKLIEWFDITPDEQRHMLTIIDAEEKQRRNTEAKRAKRGSVTRDEYLTKQSETTHGKLQVLGALVAQGLSNAKIMQVMNISKPYLHKLKQML